MEREELLTVLYALGGVSVAQKGCKCCACGKNAAHTCVYMDVDFDICRNKKCIDKFYTMIKRFEGRRNEL